MSYAPAALRRSFDLYGVTVDLHADEHTVVDAMELRLRDFSSVPVDEPGLHLEFLTTGEEPAWPLTGSGRPVYDTPHGSLYYFADADALCGELSGVHFLCQPSPGLAQLRSPAFAGRELYLATHPLVTIGLMEMLERRGLFSLHAACLASADGRGLVLAGPSGAGKSTLALALAQTGMGFLSDDIVFLTHDDGAAVRVLGFADSLGVTEHAGNLFPDIRPHLREPPAEGFPKRLIRIEQLLGKPAVSACAPAALVFPEVARNETSRIEPLDPGEALVRLVPDVLLTEPTATQAHLQAIAALLDQVRCYTLRSGTDLDRAVELARELV
jgi:hypothetical protein